MYVITRPKYISKTFSILFPIKHVTSQQFNARMDSLFSSMRERERKRLRKKVKEGIGIMMNNSFTCQFRLSRVTFGKIGSLFSKENYSYGLLRGPLSL